MAEKPTQTASGRPLADLTLEGIARDELRADDFRIRSETLRHQAEQAEAAGYRQLGENLRRAAELTHLSHEEVLEIYEALRPRRSTFNALTALAARLQGDLDAPLTAQLVREAAEVYRERGILRDSE
jgi:propanediol dehydratase small subunit